jgi:hypothetical protein
MVVEAWASRVGFRNGSSEALEEGIGTEGLEVVSSWCLILMGSRQWQVLEGLMKCARRQRKRKGVDMLEIIDRLEDLEVTFEGLGDALTGKTGSRRHLRAWGLEGMHGRSQ